MLDVQKALNGLQESQSAQVEDGYMKSMLLISKLLQEDDEVARKNLELERNREAQHGSKLVPLRLDCFVDNQQHIPSKPPLQPNCRQKFYL